MPGPIYRRKSGEPLPKCSCGCHRWLDTQPSEAGTSPPISIRMTTIGALCAYCIEELNQPWEQVLDEALRLASTTTAYR